MGFIWANADGEFMTDRIESDDKLKAEHVNTLSQSVQDFINEGISREELKGPDNIDDPKFYQNYTTSGWVDSKLIYRPEFYGSPSPRMMAVSGTTHFREKSNAIQDGSIFQVDLMGEAFQGVPGCTTTLKLRHPAVVNVMASFYCYEFGGVASETTVALPESYGHNLLYGGNKYESRAAAEFRLSVNGANQKSTGRIIYASTADATRDRGRNYLRSIYPDFPPGLSDAQQGYLFFPMIGRKQSHLIYQIELGTGTHNIGLVCKCFNQGSVSWRYSYSEDSLVECDGNKFPSSQWPKFPQSKMIFVQARNFIVDAYYTNNTPL